MKYAWLIGLLVGLLGAVEGHAQPLWGVYADLSGQPESARASLIWMHEAGVQVVRTPLVADEQVLRLADSLGVMLFQDLPLTGLTWQEMADTLALARRLLGEALRRAERYPGARYFGLATSSDEVHPRAVAYLDTLTDWVHEAGPPGSRTYIVTFFQEPGMSAYPVDLVLLDVLDEPDPLAVWHRYQEMSSTPVGIGALGTYVDPAMASNGVRVPHSPAYQARYLEEALTRAAAIGVPYVFVYRWRDREEDGEVLCTPDAYLPRAYGLHRRDGDPRPAWKVVAGLLTGRERVFAFSLGTAIPGQTQDWKRLWGVLALLALVALWVGFPMVRRTSRRYFGARFFYVQALRRGEVPGGGVLLLLAGAIALQQGLILWMGLEPWLRTTPAVRLSCAWEGWLQQLWAYLLLQPWMLVVLGAGGLLAGMGAAVGLLRLMLRTRIRMPALTAMVIWPCWVLAPLLLAMLVLTSLPARVQVQWMPRLLLAGMILHLWIWIRVGIDAFQVSGRVQHLLILPGLPLLSVAVGALLLAWRYAAVWAFVEHILRLTS